MSGEQVFQALNLAVLPWWTLWLVAPRSSWARRAAAHGGVFAALCGVYAVLLGAAFAAGGPGGFGYDALREALSQPVGFLAGWTHYLAFDLFVGAWIVRESGRLRLEPRPYLVFALLAGPVGLGAFLVRRALHLRSLGQIGQVDLA